MRNTYKTKGFEFIFIVCFRVKQRSYKMFQLVIISTLLAFSTGALIPGQRIVGGKNTSIQEVPYQVAIENIDSGYQICGGSIITTRHVLTAAHCFITYTDDPGALLVRTGSSLLQTGGSELGVSKIISHPKYEFGGYDYDLMILELVEDIVLSETSQIIKLADSEPMEGEEALLSGWGSNKDGDQPKELQSVIVPIADHKKCEELYAGNVTITERMICAGGEETGACKGDNGGPLALQTSSADKVLVGVVFWEYKHCASPGYYDVYVNIAHPEIRSFILEQTGA